MTDGLAAPEEGGAAASSMAGAAASRIMILGAIWVSLYILYESYTHPNEAADEQPDGPPVQDLPVSPAGRPTPSPCPAPSPSPSPIIYGPHP